MIYLTDISGAYPNDYSNWPQQGNLFCNWHSTATICTRFTTPHEISSEK